MLKDYVVVDLETTGLNPKLDKIIEIGAVKVKNGKVDSIYETFVNPAIKIPYRITQVTGIDDSMVENAPYIEDVIGEFAEYVEELTLVGHNLIFDFSFLKNNAVNYNISFEKMGIDTLKVARKYLKGLESKTLSNLCAHYKISDENHHRAVNDAMATKELYEILSSEFEGDDVWTYRLEYKAKRQTPITSRQEKYLRDLVARHNILIDYDINKLTKSEASRRIDNIILEYGKLF